ncbi:GrpB family protein [Deinococcus roseus]|uniref:GrpB family protein n=1 Tax=Deinococcus roseus TaxID=392414 RepID=A0ABQ2CVU1_9DEIO|nr:GrpB family protein [Deinococcus roseus]GGJ22023.1 hypothetical protein GCM10008938_05360 [Deinococcus roseus]
MPEIELVAHNPFWTKAYQHERKLLLEALIPVTGPLLIEHIGSTSIKNIAAKDVIDIMVGLTRPLSQEAIDQLVRLGYDFMGEAGLPGRMFFKRNPRTHHVHVVELGNDNGFWWEHLLFRDHLRTHPEAARRYEHIKLQLAARYPNDRPSYTSSKSPIVHALLEEAIAWEEQFGPLHKAQQAMQGAPVHWAVAGGWALDVQAHKVQRHHEDIDLMVYRDEQLPLQRFLLERGWTLERIQQGRFFPWLPGERLELPDHQIHATHPDYPSIDFLLSEGSHQHWICRRNARVTHPCAVQQGIYGIPHLVPEVVLLYKSGGRGGLRGKDLEDAERTFPGLDADQKHWLAMHLPASHPWHHTYLEGP